MKTSDSVSHSSLTLAQWSAKYLRFSWGKDEAGHICVARFKYDADNTDAVAVLYGFTFGTGRTKAKYKLMATQEAINELARASCINRPDFAAFAEGWHLRTC